MPQANGGVRFVMGNPRMNENLIERLRKAANALPPRPPEPPHPLYGLLHEAAKELARQEIYIARSAATHHLSPIVRMVQLAETWSDVQKDKDGQYGVTIFFDCQDDADAFKVELMMAASGQAGYEPDELLKNLRS